MYKDAPVIVDKYIETNIFTDIILQTRNTTSAAMDKLAWLA